MYISPPRSKFFVSEDMGTNAPKDHQRVIGRLMTALGHLYYVEKRIALEPLVETMLDEGRSSPTPDLILYDTAIEQTRVIIEVCHTNGLKNDLDKVIWLIEQNSYGIQEGFVFNYRTERWYRYVLGAGGLSTESSYSDVLQLDLATFLG